MMNYGVLTLNILIYTGIAFRNKAHFSLKYAKWNYPHQHIYSCLAISSGMAYSNYVSYKFLFDLFPLQHKYCNNALANLRFFKLKFKKILAPFFLRACWLPEISKKQHSLNTFLLFWFAFLTSHVRVEKHNLISFLM